MENVNQASAIDDQDLQELDEEMEDFEESDDDDYSSELFDDDDDDYGSYFKKIMEEEQTIQEPEEEDVEELETFEEEEPSDYVQTPEENAYYAEQRRQQQLQEKVQAELQQSTEYQIVKMLSDQYGVTPEEMYAQMQEAAMEKQAAEQGVSVEYLRRLQAAEQARVELEERLNRIEFENWYAQKQNEGQQVIESYNGIITEDDVQDAISFMLNDLGTTNMTIDKVVRLLHGDKLESELKRLAKQEALAEFSGRKASPLAPQSGKTQSTASSLTAEERYFAKKLGLSDDQYSKYMSQ